MTGVEALHDHAAAVYPGSGLKTQIRLVRLCGILAVIAMMWFWLFRSTGSLAPSAAILTAGFAWACAIFGSVLARMTQPLLDVQAGIAFELTFGFLFGNTILFLLTLISPFGFGFHLSVMTLAVLSCAFLPQTRPERPKERLRAEVHSVAIILFVGVAASLWVAEQQPLMKIDGDHVVFTVWTDAFIHAREISAFAQSHGFATLSDIKLAGVPAAAYHFASYMMPAALNALTSTSALNAYGAFQLPFGILLMGMATYSLTAVAFRATGPAVIGAACVVALPDAYQQGFGMRLLSFHFMSQVNLGMLYGLACIAVAWLFMIEACRRERWAGMAVAFVLLSVCATYKVHLFVANALILMLYPCVFYGRFQPRSRLFAAVGVTTMFIVVVVISQLSPRVPTLRIDGSGFGAYAAILLDGSTGRFVGLFKKIYLRPDLPHIINALLVSVLILIGSFGIWLIVTPLALWKVRPVTGPRVGSFVLLIVLNYLAMSMLLALDERGIGAKEEFVNRPHAWAYLVVVSFGAAALVMSVRTKFRISTGSMRVSVAVFAVLALICVDRFSDHLETFPEWPEHAFYSQFNSTDACFVRAAQYIRDHGHSAEIVLDSQFDPLFIGTAVSERQSYLVDANFGGAKSVVSERVTEIKALQSAADFPALQNWAVAHHIRWYLMHPETDARSNERFADRAVYRCDDYRLFEFGS